MPQTLPPGKAYTEKHTKHTHFHLQLILLNTAAEEAKKHSPLKVTVASVVNFYL